MAVPGGSTVPCAQPTGVGSARQGPAPGPAGPVPTGCRLPCPPRLLLPGSGRGVRPGSGGRDRCPAHTERRRRCEWCGHVSPDWGPVSRSAQHVRADRSRMRPLASPPSRASPARCASPGGCGAVPRASATALQDSVPPPENRLAQEAGVRLGLASPATSFRVRAPLDLGDGDGHDVQPMTSSGRC